MSVDAELLLLEHRGDRAGIGRDPSTLILPNGSVIRCGDIQMTGALAKAVLVAYGMDA